MNEGYAPRIVKLVVDCNSVLLFVCRDSSHLIRFCEQSAVGTRLIKLKLRFNSDGMLQQLWICKASKADLVVYTIFFLNRMLSTILDFRG